MQVDVLRQRCVVQTLFRLSPSNILSSVSVADQLGEQPLLDACLEYWATLPNRWAETKHATAVDTCCTLRTCLLIGIFISSIAFTIAVAYTCYRCTWLLHARSSEIVKSSEMADLMRDNTALAQELLATVMDHPAKKARAA